MIALDTDVVIDVLRSYTPAIKWLIALNNEEVAIPGFVAMEIIQGCRSKSEQLRVEHLMEQFLVVWPSSNACDAALTLFSEYHLSDSLGLLDAIVGQTALELGLPLHTFNQKHYRIIAGLQTVQPYSR